MTWTTDREAKSPASPVAPPDRREDGSRPHEKSREQIEAENAFQDKGRQL